MQLMVSRLVNFYDGLMVSLKDGDEIKDIALINGNKPDFLGPIILLSLDQEIVYGLSQNKVVSRIYSQGPQILISNKELSHKLFEHGMKASLGKVKVGNLTFMTGLETFYKLLPSYSHFSIVGSEGRLGCFIKPADNYLPILLATSGFNTKNDVKNRIDVDKIQTTVCKQFELNPEYL